MITIAHRDRAEFSKNLTFSNSNSIVPIQLWVLVSYVTVMRLYIDVLVLGTFVKMKSGDLQTEFLVTVNCVLCIRNICAVQRHQYVVFPLRVCVCVCMCACDIVQIGRREINLISKN